MFNKIGFVLLLCAMLQATAIAQPKVTISGKVTDRASGETLINATVLDQNSGLGTVTNNYGFYSLTLPEGEIKLLCSYVGYTPSVQEFDLHKDIQLNIDLTGNKELDEIMVTATRSHRSDMVQTSRIELPMSIVQKLPSMLGEKDLLKSIQLMPGIQGGSEASAGIYVRGGNSDQNLILLDGVPVYNASHLFGFFSVFIPEAIKNVTVYKGGFPARFGGRLSSVIDVRMKEGNQKELHGNFTIGLISSKFNLEGPLNTKTSFNISARRTYYDLLEKTIGKLTGFDPSISYFFHDYNAKINYTFNDRSRLYLSIYNGRDKAYNEEKEKLSSFSNNMNWGNLNGILRWNYTLSNKLFLNSSAALSRYSYTIIGKSSNSYSQNKEYTYSKYNSKINDAILNSDFDYHPGANHNIKFGASYVNHHYRPGIQTISGVSADAAKLDTVISGDNIRSHELSLYAEDDFRISKRFTANAGIRTSLYHVQGENFSSVESRLTLIYTPVADLAIKASYSKMTQYLHLLSSSIIDMPTDLWLPATKKVKPQQGYQYVFGADYSTANALVFSVEGFYKAMDNLIEYKDGASFLGTTGSWENKIETGRGWSYGAELMVRKDKGATTGWLAYTLSWANRKFENINLGNAFPSRYDRRHCFNIVVTHQFSKRFDIGATWVYYTGNYITLATHQFDIPGYIGGMSGTAHYIKNRYNYRLADYHRLDLNANFHKKRLHGSRTWSIGVYNAYNQFNPYSVYPSEKYNHDTETISYRITEKSLFPIILSVSYQLNF